MNRHVIVLFSIVLAFAVGCSVTPAAPEPTRSTIPSPSATAPALSATRDLLARSAQSTPTNIEPATIPTEEPTATPSLEPTATITLEPTTTPTLEPTATATTVPTESPTRTPASTPLPVFTVGACAEIWRPGYYKLTNDIKTPGQDCFYVQSHNVVFDCDNHTIEGRNFQGYAFFVRKFGFPFLQTPTNVEIKNCKVKNHRTGIFVGGGNNVYIHHNDLSNNFDDTDKRRFGEFLGQSEGGGLRLDTVSGGRVEYNTTNNSAIGIDLRDSNRVAVRHNTASNNSAWGINLIHTSNSEITSNTVRDNIRWCAWGNGTVGRGCDAGGITLQDGSSHNVVSGNLVEGDNGNGVFIKAHFMRCDDDNLIQGNKITNSVYNGIELGFCKNNKAINNEISGSVDGILFGFDSDTEIRGNVISNMANHGITSWNSRGTQVEKNTILSSREAIFFYWDKWDPKQFSFLPASPDQYASRDHLISGNVLRDNSVAAIHLLNSTNNRVLANTMVNNGRNYWLEGKVGGNVIPALTPGAMAPTLRPTEPAVPATPAQADPTARQPSP